MPRKFEVTEQQKSCGEKADELFGSVEKRYINRTLKEKRKPLTRIRALLARSISRYLQKDGD